MIDIGEKTKITDEIQKYLCELVLSSYRDLDFLKDIFSSSQREKLEKYLREQVFPSLNKPLSKNVWQGDFGEIITKEMAEKFRDLEVPYCKLRYKLNKDNSLSATDVFAKNKGDVIKEMYHYEVKTRTTSDPLVAIEAHSSLEKVPKVSIADMLMREHHKLAKELEKVGNNVEAEKNRSLVIKYSDVVNNPHKYKHLFEIVLIIEKAKFKEEILTKLNDISPSLSPLTVTVILLDNFGKTVIDIFERIISQTTEEICNSKR